MVLCKAPRSGNPEWTQPVTKRTCISKDGTGYEGNSGWVASACDEGMVQFVLDAFENDNTSVESNALSEDVMSCLSWMSQHTAEDTNARREAMICAIEADSMALHLSGAVDRWFGDADEHIRAITEGVNGPLLDRLLSAAGHEDLECTEVFRHGAQLLGKMVVTGNGRQETKKRHESLSELYETCGTNNRDILARLKEDVEHSDELYRLTCLDSDLRRMTPLQCCDDIDMDAVLISQRFGVAQGVKDDGSPKVRCVDSCTESGVNPCTESVEHLSPDGLDKLFEIMRWMWCFMNVVPQLLKIDIDSAFRRVPIRPAHRWAAYVGFVHKGTTCLAGHLSMPFGAASSVFAWDRVGAAITKIARVILKIPLLRYVDDMFSAERAECVVHCRDCVVRLVKALLGAGSVSAKKVCSGLPLEVLGVSIDADTCGAVFWPSEAKVAKWLHRISHALEMKEISSGASNKLAGALSWSAQNVFHRLGRALLRPLYGKRRFKKWTLQIESSLRWWHEVLTLQIQQRRLWVLPVERTVQVFCDARSTPPRLAAVVYAPDGQSYYTDMEPPQVLLDFFEDRRDAQICGLELCAIALALSTFGEFCEGRKVHVWSDNCGSEHATRRGSAKAWDHNHIVHALWVKAAMLRCHLWVDRVPTKVNISDLPSREEYGLLHAMNTKFVEPVLDEMFWSHQAWDTVALKGALQ